MSSKPEDTFDVIVVGAGPAGIAAAAAAGRSGARVALLDSGAEPGGQYWRGAASAGVPGYLRLAHQLDPAGVVRLPRHWVRTVIADGAGWRLDCGVGPEPRASSEQRIVRGARLVLAPGAYDRQLPFPGWELPGVLAAGGVQALLKAHGVLAGQRVVVAGTGPFLLPVAAGLLKAGANVPAVLEANSPAGFVRHPRAIAGAAGKLAEAAGYAALLVRHRTPYRQRHAVIEALGADRLEAVRIARLDRQGLVVDGTERTVRCDTLAVGWGFTAQLELPLQLGCATVLGPDGGLAVQVDDEQRTDVAGVWAAGESTGIGGADLAVVEGEIAGLSAAGRPVPAPLLTRRAALRRFATALHAVHPVPAFLLAGLPDETLVCRCEEVTAGSVRAAVTELGATEARTVKLLTRTGMGWCQGRVCGAPTAGLTAATAGRPVGVGDLRCFADRPMAAPVPLGLLAATED